MENGPTTSTAGAGPASHPMPDGEVTVPRGKRKRGSALPEETEDEGGWDSADGKSTGDEEEVPQYPSKQVPSPREGEPRYFTEKRANIEKRKAIDQSLKQAFDDLFDGLKTTKTIPKVCCSVSCSQFLIDRVKS